MSSGTRSKSCWVKVMSWWSIQLPLTTITTAIPASFGTNVRVNSCTWVTDWSSETPTPMASDTMRIGAASLAVIIIAETAMSMTVESFMDAGLLLEGRDQGTDHEGPAIDHDEQQQLERQG